MEDMCSSVHKPTILCTIGAFANLDSPEREKMTLLEDDARRGRLRGTEKRRGMSDNTVGTTRGRRRRDEECWKIL
jgi:hypothetical protein